MMSGNLLKQGANSCGKPIDEVCFIKPPGFPGGMFFLYFGSRLL